MFTSLAQFYNSDGWKNLRATLIAERTHPFDGVLYDEFSGEALTRSYDIVAHHVIPLTMSNVNDFSISLNPANIQLVSQKSHNIIHGRFGYCTQRKVYYVYGAPRAGKTTFVNEIKGNSDIIVDIDTIWEAITGSRYDKPNALKQNVFALRDCMYDMIRTRAGKWERAFIVTSGAVRTIRERELDSFSAEEIFIDESKETCLMRLYDDQTMTDIQKAQWTKYINKWFDDYTE